MIKKKIYNKININIKLERVWYLDLKFYIKNHVSKTAQTANVDFLPPMARRKLSAVDKIALCVMNECLAGIEGDEWDLKIVFASRYGELDRLKKLVAQYTTENEVSPAAFSGSVHNSAVGQFSLINKITQSYNSVSAEENTFSAGLIEAVITAKNCDVIYCYCDAVTLDSACGFGCLISSNHAPNAVLKDGKLYELAPEGEKCLF